MLSDRTEVLRRDLGTIFVFSDGNQALQQHCHHWDITDPCENKKGAAAEVNSINPEKISEIKKHQAVDDY